MKNIKGIFRRGGIDGGRMTINFISMYLYVPNFWGDVSSATDSVQIGLDFFDMVVTLLLNQ